MLAPEFARGTLLAVAVGDSPAAVKECSGPSRCASCPSILFLHLDRVLPHHPTPPPPPRGSPCLAFFLQVALAFFPNLIHLHESVNKCSYGDCTDTSLRGLVRAGKMCASFWEVEVLGTSWGPDWALWPRRAGLEAGGLSRPSGGRQGAVGRCTERHPGPPEPHSYCPQVVGVTGQRGSKEGCLASGNSHCSCCGNRGQIPPCTHPVGRFKRVEGGARAAL